ncbi:hypothetical protein [Sphingopyxis sp.]|uniref:hypothetical protein n=1 Tax=Sphingopyxis sp. TaxID=1908224 RepID=UPI002DF9D925|nr:hypothetical protein [Sphingopyxis sp.]
MVSYSIPLPSDPTEIGKRAQRLRSLLGMSVSDVASEAGVNDGDVIRLEQGSDVSLVAALAIHRVLSGELVSEVMFTRPRLKTIDEVEAFEARRLANR